MARATGRKIILVSAVNILDRKFVLYSVSASEHLFSSEEHTFKLYIQLDV